MIPLKIVSHIPIELLEELYKNELFTKQARRYLTNLEGYRTNFYPNTNRISKHLRVCTKTIRNWIHDWNDYGPEGLIIKKQEGRPSTLSNQEIANLISFIELNPRNSGFDFITWTLKTMKYLISKEIKKDLSFSAISRLLKQYDIVKIKPRPMPSKGDLKKKEQFKQDLGDILIDFHPDDVLLYQDESSFYQSGTIHAKWAKKGSNPILKIYGTYSRLNVFGIINPITGQSHFQYIKRLNAESFITYLKAIRREYPDANRIFLIIDNGPGHRAKKVDIYLKKEYVIKLIKLPPYSPDLNPIETVWHEVKKDVVYITFYPLMVDFRTALTESLRNFQGSKAISLFNVQKYMNGAKCSY